MKRRNFIKHSSLAMGGMLMHGGFMSLAQDTAPKKLNIGIIGCGSRGSGIISVLKELKEKYRVAGICDLLDFRLKGARERAAADKPAEYKDYKKLLENKKIGAIVIATPLYLHFQMAKDALMAGKHVYLEKTMTFTAEEALQLAAISKERPGQVLQIGHQLPYTPLYQRAKEIIEKGYLGKITQIDCRYDRNSDWRNPVPDPSLERALNWRMYKEYSGGLVAELLAHQIQFVNWALNTHPVEIFSTGGIDFYKDGRETYDNVQVMLRYGKEGIVGNFGSTLANVREGFIYKIKGSKGTLELLINEGRFFPEEKATEHEVVDGVAGATKIEWKKEGGTSILKEPIKDGTWYAFDDFHKCITEKQKPLIDVASGAAAAVTVALANKALYTHTIQRWEPGYNV